MFFPLLLQILLGKVNGQGVTSTFLITTPLPITTPLTIPTTTRLPAIPITEIPQPTTFLGPRRTIKVGVAASDTILQQNIGFSVCGGAIPLSLEYLRKQGYLQNVDFQFYVNYTECDPALTVNVGLDFIKNKEVDVIIGPMCPNSIRMMGYLGTYYNTFMVAWGYAFDVEFNDLKKFPTLASIMPNAIGLGYISNKVLEFFGFDRVSVLYMNNDVGYCESITNALETAALDETTYSPTIAMKSQLPRNNPQQYKSLLDTAKSRSRIIMACFDQASETREFFWRANENGMATEEYLYIIMSMKRQAGITNVTLNSSGLTPFWLDAYNGNTDQKDESARQTARRTIVVDLSTYAADLNWMNTFRNTVVARVRNDPFYCDTPACLANLGKNPGGFSRHLHDAFFMYGLSLTSALTRDPLNGYRDPSILQDGVQVNFMGLTGEVSINSNTTRNPFFMLYALDSDDQERTFANMTFLSGVAAITPAWTDESVLWATRGGHRPLTIPICGYSGQSCPKEFWEQNLLFVVIGAALAFVIALILIFLVVYLIRARHVERARLNAEWQIASTRLQKPVKKSRANASKPSLRSDPSTMTTLTGDSKSMGETANAKFYEVYILERDPVFVTEHDPVRLTLKDGEQFIKLRKLDHLNLNNFIGLSIDGTDYKAVWKYCSRSSLFDIISNGNMNTADAFFVFCVIRDIAEGLDFLHNSFVGCHGMLHSGCCLVNDGWQIKISDFGLNHIPEGKKIKDKTLLWKSPEHLRQPGISAPGDIYSFAIIASEVINRKPAWSVRDRKESLDEILYLIKKGGHRPIRPEFDADDLELSPALYALIRDCWAEEPVDRPTTETIKKLLKSIVPNQKQNLIDHVFNKLEEYTSSLELEVEDRTKELVAEKKKADVLLSKMLPKQVADKLKLGQTVEPEGFDSVTVMFMDVVKFTQLAARCSPFQVVNLLNELYTNFDNIIDQHSVYKVESIGDGYLCVSGLPTRNGYNHIKEIVSMCLVIREYVRNYKINHLPREKVQLRFGINSGPCVAGVVGLSMPRYCLFGDTVNTASRMESNGKADHIHMSSIAHSLLVDHFPGQYQTQSRGDVIIKGKGVMETFWILGRITDGSSMYSKQSSPRIHGKAQITPQQSVEKAVTKHISPEIKSVDDYDTETVHTEPLYRHYSRQTTIKTDDF